MTVDAVLGLAIVAMLAAALAVALNRRHHAAERLDDQRTAAEDAERALVQLQSGKRPTVDGVVVEPASAGDGAAAPRGYAWVRVRGERNGRSASLVGLVPAEGGVK